ncbi:MAG: outer membrane lipoprotein carrier protein LolA [bacterium]
MRKNSLCLSFALSLLFCLQLSAQTVDELVQRNIEARGGYDKIKAVKTMKFTGTVMVQGMEMPTTVITERPNKMRIEAIMQGQTMVQAYDGQTAWWIFPFMGNPDPQKMPEEQAKEFIKQADIDGHLVDYKEKGYKVELLGKEDMEGTDVYKLKLTLKNGDVEYVYLDSEYFIELKQITKTKRQGAEIEVATYFGDYKDVDGLMLPHSIESKIGDQTVNQITVKEIALNVDVDDSLFKMPEVAKKEESTQK